MENLIFFVLGTLFSAGLIGLWFLIKRVLKISKKINTLEHEINVYIETASDSFNEVHKRINEVCNIIDNNYNDTYKEIDELRSYVDSRIDKTIATLSFTKDFISEKNKTNK